jgi:hypothetical protein
MAQIESVNGDILNIHPTSKAARTMLYDVYGTPMHFNEGDQPTGVGGAGILQMGLNDEMILPIRMDRMGSTAIATNQPLFTDSFEGTTINPIRWTITATTMAATQSSIAGITMNSGTITTINTGYMLKSNRAFLKSQRQPLLTKIRLRPEHYNNSVMEFGFGDASTFNGVNTTGAYWQITPTGVLQPVITYNSVDIIGSDARSLIDITKYYTFDVYADDDEATFTIQDTSSGLIINKQTIKLPLTAQRLLSSSQLPVMVRVYNTGVAPATAPKLYLEDIYVYNLDGNNNASINDVYALMHRSAMDNVFTGVQAAAWANSAEPASATLSNTAAGYTTLGGKFQFAAVAGAVTDYCLFGFQVPSPATLVVTDIEIETWNTGAAVATTASLLTWAAGANFTAVSLATATGNRVGLGAQSLPVGAAVGALATPINRSFKTPIVTGPGRWFNIILRMPVGTATALQIIAGMVNINGYWN